MQKKNVENVCLRTKFDLRLKKKTKKFLGQNFKIFLCRHQKNASHTIPIYGNCMISIFFKKREPQFFITRLFYKNQTSTEISLYQFSTILRNCMKIVSQAFFHTLDVWNCMITIFGVWRSTRVAENGCHKIIPNDTNRDPLGGEGVNSLRKGFRP